MRNCRAPFAACHRRPVRFMRLNIIGPLAMEQRQRGDMPYAPARLEYPAGEQMFFTIEEDVWIVGELRRNRLNGDHRI